MIHAMDILSFIRLSHTTFMLCDTISFTSQQVEWPFAVPSVHELLVCTEDCRRKAQD